MLEQLHAICGRILALPACGPLKAALTGVELLLSRAQTWEEGAASHVSLAAQLQLCAQLARRWRAAELSSWPRALAAAARAAAALADATWFPLYRLLFAGQPPDEPDAAASWLRGVATALEEFLRGAAQGEYERRVALLWAFHTHASLETACGAPGYAPLAGLLYNLHRYYFLFVGDVRAALDSARRPIEVKLKEHAKLAKWEVRCRHLGNAASACTAAHLRTARASNAPGTSQGFCTDQRGSLGGCHEAVRVHPILSQHLGHPQQRAPLSTLTRYGCSAQDRGYHALRQSSERNQRVLHRLVHSWEEALARPVAPLFAAAAAAVGSANELAGPESAAVPQSVASAKDVAGTAAPALTIAGGVNLKAAADAQAAIDADAALNAEAAALAALSAAWDAHVSTAVVAVSADVAAVLTPLRLVAPATPDSYLGRLLPLSLRLGTVLGSALADGQSARRAGSVVLDDIAIAVAKRTAALRSDRNATRPIKKKVCQP